MCPQAANWVNVVEFLLSNETLGTTERKMLRNFHLMAILNTQKERRWKEASAVRRAWVEKVVDQCGGHYWNSSNLLETPCDFVAFLCKVNKYIWQQIGTSVHDFVDESLLDFAVSHVTKKEPLALSRLEGLLLRKPEFKEAWAHIPLEDAVVSESNLGGRAGELYSLFFSIRSANQTNPVSTPKALSQFRMEQELPDVTTKNEATLANEFRLRLLHSHVPHVAVTKLMTRLVHPRLAKFLGIDERTRFGDLIRYLNHYSYDLISYAPWFGDSGSDEHVGGRASCDTMLPSTETDPHRVAHVCDGDGKFEPDDPCLTMCREIQRLARRSREIAHLYRVSLPRLGNGFLDEFPSCGFESELREDCWQEISTENGPCYTVKTSGISGFFGEGTPLASTSPTRPID